MTTGPEPDNQTTQDHAHGYAQQGLRVIPIKPGTKYPAIDQWQNVATTDPDTINNWWSGLYRTWGIGIVTGALSGLWALDVDVANNKPGMQSLTDLVDTYGELGNTARARTPTGGLHILYRWDPNHPVSNIQSNTTLLGPGLDIRGEGGQILVAPSIHPVTQTQYTWTRHPRHGILDAPPWLYALLERDDAPTTDTLPQPVNDTRDNDDSAAQQTSNHYHFPTLLETDGWTRYKPGSDELWTRPGKHRSDGLSARLFDGTGPLVIFSSEAPPNIRKAGIPTKGNTAISLSLFGYVAATRFGGDRSETARHIRQQINANNTNYELDIQQFRTQIGTTNTTQTSTDPDNRLRPHLYTTQQLGQRPPPQPLLNGWLNRNSLAFLVGPPKSGKTFIAIDIALSIATGHQWIGGTQTQPGNVLYILGEGVAGVHNRVLAWREARQHNTPDQITWIDRAVQLKSGNDIRDLLNICIDYRPDLIVIDTLARGTVGIEENSSKEMGEAIAGLDAIKAATGACVLVIHHTGKANNDIYRGSSALAGAWDTLLRVKGDTRGLMTVHNAQQKDIEDGHEFNVRFDSHAGSIAPVRTDEPPAGDNQASGHTKARMSFLSAGRRYRGAAPLPYTGWRDRASGARAGELRPAFMTLVDDGYFVTVESDRGRDIELYRFDDPGN